MATENLYVGLDISIKNTGVMISYKDQYIPIEIAASTCDKIHSPSVNTFVYKRSTNPDFHKDVNIIHDFYSIGSRIKKCIEYAIDKFSINTKNIHVGVEGISVGGFAFQGTNNVQELAEIGILIKNMLLRMGVDGTHIHIYPPKRLKLLYAGNGSAKKIDIKRKFIEYQNFPLTYSNTIDTDDILDANALVMVMKNGILG